MTHINPPTIEMPPGEGEPPKTSIMTEAERVTEPPTDWINLPVVTQCQPCEEEAEAVRYIQADATQNLDRLDGANLTEGERQNLWRSLWANKRLYDQALAKLRACERKYCPPAPSKASAEAATAETAQADPPTHPGTPAGDIDPSLLAWRFGLNGGITHIDPPRAGFGTVINGTEAFLGRTEDTLDGYQLEIGGELALLSAEEFQKMLDAGWAGRRPSPIRPGEPGGLSLFFNGSYGRAEGDSSATEPVGGNGVAITYFNFDSPAGFTGVNFGMTGMDLVTEAEYSGYGLDLGARLHRPLGDRTMFTLSPSLRYQGSQFDYFARAESLTFTDSFMEVDQEVDEDRLGLGLGLQVTHGFGNGFYGFIGGGVWGYGRDAELSSTQRINVPVNPNIADRNFTVDQTDDDDGFGYGISGRVGAGYAWRHWIFDVAAELERLSDVAEVENPASPNGEPTHLDTTDQTAFSLMVGASYRF